MKSYYEQREEARQEAIEWKNNRTHIQYSWSELQYWTEYFEKQGKKYGLLGEFREAGLC